MQKMAFPRKPIPFTLVETVDFVRNSEPKCENPVSFMRVFTVGDLYDNEGAIKTWDMLSAEYHLGPESFLNCHSLVKAIPKKLVEGHSQSFY